MHTISLINHAITYLERHLCQPVTIEDTAATVGYSRWHFSRIFGNLTGLMPVDYLRKRRLSEAARELLHSSKCILDIALDYQFQSQEAFTRSFRQEFGISPGFYRRRGRAGRLLQQIRLGCTHLLYPGKGIGAHPPILLPVRNVTTALLTTQVRPGVYLFTMVPATPNPTIKLRPAHRQDIPALCRLYHELHEFTMRGVPNRLRSLGEWECYDATWLTGEVEKLLDTLEMSIWVAEVDGQVVGMAEVHLRTDKPDPATIPHRYGYLQSLVVLPHLRGRGIGAQLLSAAERWSKENGATELQLDTWDFEKGPLGFYTQQGYRTLRRTLVRKL